VANLRADALRFEPEYGHYLVFRGKGDKERVVPVDSAVLDAINATDYESEWMVANEDGSPVTYDTVNGVVDTAAAKAKVRIYPHMLRHHYLTRLVRAGANPFAIQQLAGHASIATTQRYIHMDLTDLVEAASLDPRREGGLRVVSSPIQVRTAAAGNPDSGTPGSLPSAAVR
jgi:site-specific recombinase XerD